MKKKYSAIAGFLIAPLVSAITILALEMINDVLHPMHIDSYVWIFIFYCYAFVATVIIGGPVFLLLNHFDKITWWSATFTGLFGGIVMILIFKSLNYYIIITAGGLSAFVFWLIWTNLSDSIDID